MSKVKFAKFILLSVLWAVLMFSSAFSAFATCESEFSLSDVQAQNGRLFEVTLSAKGDVNLSSFVTELVYDTKFLSFSFASVSREDAQYSINEAEEGKLTAVYLCEDGVSLKDTAPLMTFVFKAVEMGNTDIMLSVRDAINSDLTDVAVSECLSSKVTISGASTSSAKSNKSKTVNQKNRYSENVASADESEISFIDGRTDIAGLSVSNQTLVSLVLSFVCTMCVAVYVAYKLGLRKQRNSQKSVSLNCRAADLDSKQNDDIREVE